MKYRLEIEGDYYEDFSVLKGMVNMSAMKGAIWEARELILERRNRKEDLSDEEYDFLTNVAGALYIEGIEDQSITPYLKEGA